MGISFTSYLLFVAVAVAVIVPITDRALIGCSGRYAESGQYPMDQHKVGDDDSQYLQHELDVPR